MTLEDLARRFEQELVTRRQTPLMDRCAHCGAVLTQSKDCPNQDRKAHQAPA